MADTRTTFSTKREIKSFPIKVELAIPPEKPELQGFIYIDGIVRTKPEIKALGEEGLSDEEYLPRIASAIHGLGDPETDEPLVGEAAFKEALQGRYSMYLVPAIVDAYFSQYGEARRKNSLRRR